MVGKRPNLKTVKALLAKDCNQMVKVKATGDNIIHLCAKMCKDFEVLEYLVQNLKIDIFERNLAGDTVLSICQQTNNEKAIALIQKVQDLYDDSGKNTDALLEELQAEDA